MYHYLTPLLSQGHMALIWTVTDMKHRQPFSSPGHMVCVGVHLCFASGGSVLPLKVAPRHSPCVYWGVVDEKNVVCVCVRVRA